MSISLPDSLNSFADQQVSDWGYGTSSEYVRELIHKDQDRQRARGLLLVGPATAPVSPANAGYFDGLRDRVGPGCQAGFSRVKVKPVVPRE